MIGIDDKYSVGIIGCGWLGKALALELIDNQISVIVTTQNTDKMKRLERHGINVELLCLPMAKDEKFNLTVFNQHSLVICITPQFRQGRVDYPDKIAQLVALAEQGNVKQLIMISSTAIYNGLSGNVDEESVLNLSADKVGLLDIAEKNALSFKGKTTILRLSGLVGPDRHPGKFIKDNRKLTEPNSPINLIHQKDAVGLIKKILIQNEISGIYNGVSKTNASKQKYYQTAAQALNLPQPNFVLNDSITEGKKVLGEKIRQQLGYYFVYDDLVHWLLDDI